MATGVKDYCRASLLMEETLFQCHANHLPFSVSKRRHENRNDASGCHFDNREQKNIFVSSFVHFSGTLMSGNEAKCAL